MQLVIGFTLGLFACTGLWPLALAGLIFGLLIQID